MISNLKELVFYHVSSDTMNILTVNDFYHFYGKPEWVCLGEL